MENVRVPLVFEGVKTVDGRLILEGALYWPELPLPVFIKSLSSWESVIRVGEIVGLERIDSVIWADLELNMEMPSEYVLSLDGDSAVFQYDCYDSSVIIFTKMQVRGGTLIPRDSWAWQ